MSIVTLTLDPADTSSMNQVDQVVPDRWRSAGWKLAGPEGHATLRR